MERVIEFVLLYIVAESGNPGEDELVLTMLQGSDTYIEADDAHTFVFDVYITLAAGGTGANGAAFDRWALQVDILETPSNTVKATKTLRRDGTPQRLTPAQADLSIAAGATGKMESVSVNFDLSGTGLTPPAHLCPDTRYRLRVTLLPGTKTPAPNYMLVDNAGAANAIVNLVTPALTCRGVKFLEPTIDSVYGGPVLEAEMNNAITVSMTFPIDSNGGHVAANYPADLWRVLIYLTNNVNGMGLPLAQQDAVLTANEIRSLVQFAAPLKFNNKMASLDMFGKICPATLYICVQLLELPGQNPDYTIDTSMAVKCEPMECRSVKFTSADLMFDPAQCLVEHTTVNEIKFDFNAVTAPGYASVTAPPGADLWKVSAYGSVSFLGDGINRFGLNQTVFETSLVSGNPFLIDDATLQLNLATFVCPLIPVYLCVAVERNGNAVPVFSFTRDSFQPLRSCDPIICKGVKMTNIALVDALNAVTERSGVTTIVTDVQVATDPKYAGVEGTNLWKITGELRDPDTGNVVLSQPATLSTQQRNQGLVPGTSTTFNDISVAFDLDRNVSCPPSGNVHFCVIFDKSGSRSPDFSIDETSIKENCRLLACRGVCVAASTVSPVGDDAQLKEGISMQTVKLDATFYSDHEYAGIVDQDARNLWKVNVFASPDGTQRLAETPATLDINNANYPLPSGGSLSLSNIMATLDFTAPTYITCSDVKYICVELKRDEASIPTFSLFGCPTTKLIACAPSMCQGANFSGNSSTPMITVPTTEGNGDRVQGCLQFMKPANGSLVPDQDVYIFGQIVTVYCLQGFDLIGDERIVCSETGKWHGRLPRCSEENQGTSGGGVINIIIISASAGGVIILAVVVVILLVVCYRKRSKTPEDIAPYYTRNLPQTNPAAPQSRSEMRNPSSNNVSGTTDGEYDYETPRDMTGYQGLELSAMTTSDYHGLYAQAT